MNVWIDRLEVEEFAFNSLNVILITGAQVDWTRSRQRK
jgi:hypothetical protein